MMNLNFRSYLTHPASLAGLLRAGLVAGNLAVLLALAWLLGLDGFGELIVLWGLVLVASALLGCGGPLHILARLGDGGGMHPHALFRLCLGLPALAAVAAGFALHQVWPGLPWAAVLTLALAVNLASCLASALRALGSLHLSMALRDGAPLLALGLAGLTRAEAPLILWLAAAGLGVICAWVAWLIWRHGARADLIAEGRPAAAVSLNLWAVAVLGMVLTQVDIVLGGQLLTPEQIGIYALLRRLANLVALPMSVATWVSAGQISAAHAASDLPALQSASDAGARIALLPGLGLAALCLLALPLLVWWQPALPVPVLLVLLAGTILQLAFAQGMSVATLTGRGDLAAGARLAGLLTYVAAMLLAAPRDPMGNALAYVLGTSLCSAMLWLWLWRGTGVNTLALQGRARPWRMS